MQTWFEYLVNFWRLQLPPDVPLGFMSPRSCPGIGEKYLALALQCSKDVMVLLAAMSTKNFFSSNHTLTAAVTLSPKRINSPGVMPGGILSQERTKNMHLCSLGKNVLPWAGASECLMFDVCDVMWPNAALSLYAVAALHRKHHHVRSTAALRVWVRAHRRHLLHLADPDGAADGGSDHSDVALAHDRGRAPELGLLRRLTRLPARVHRWANTNTRKGKETWREFMPQPPDWYFQTLIDHDSVLAFCNTGLLQNVVCWIFGRAKVSELTSCRWYKRGNANIQVSFPWTTVFCAFATTPADKRVLINLVVSLR